MFKSSLHSSPVPFASLLHVRSFVEKGFLCFSRWGDHSWRSTCGNFSWVLSFCFALCRHLVLLPLVSWGVFFIYGNRAFNSFGPLEGICQYKCSWTFLVCQTQTRRESQPPTHLHQTCLKEHHQNIQHSWSRSWHHLRMRRTMLVYWFHPGFLFRIPVLIRKAPFNPLLGDVTLHFWF